jgi:hypothetical protein
MRCLSNGFNEKSGTAAREKTNGHLEPTDGFGGLWVRDDGFAAIDDLVELEQRCGSVCHPKQMAWIWRPVRDRDNRSACAQWPAIVYISSTGSPGAPGGGGPGRAASPSVTSQLSQFQVEPRVQDLNFRRNQSGLSQLP